MKTRRTPRHLIPRRLLLAISLCLLAATGSASAQPCGTGGCAFWATEVNDSWFNTFRWGGIIPWQGGVPLSDVTCRIELPVQVDVLGQGQFASCFHLQFNNTGAVVRVAGSSFRSELNVHGTQMDNNGLILVGGQDALQDSLLIIHNNTNANGANGRIRLSAPSATHGAFLTPANNLGWLLVNWPSHTIEGNGNVRVRLNNEGTVDANVAGRELVFDGSHTVNNTGTVRASNGGNLRLAISGAGAVFEQSGGGETDVTAGSSLTLGMCGNDGIRGGTILGSGQVTVNCQGHPIENVQLAAGLGFGFVGNSGLLVRPGGITNNTVIRTGAAGFVTSPQGQTGVLRGSGRVQLEGFGLTNLFGGGGQAMVNEAGHTIGGIGQIALALTNRGTVTADRNGLTTGPSELQFQTSAQANEGVIEARNGGVVRLREITMDQTATGQLRALDGSAIALTGSTTPARVRGGSLFTSGSGVIAAAGSNDVLENLRIEAGSRVFAPCAQTLKLVGNIDNRGRITVDNSGCGPSFATLQGDGAVTVLGNGEIRLLASGPGVNNTLQGLGGTLVLGSAQMLTGTGRISGAVRADGIVMPDQTYAPLGPVGTISVNSGSTLSFGPTTRYVVDMASAGSFDRIDGSGNVQVAGTIMINLVNGYVPPLGSQFDLITGASVTGTIPRVELPPELAARDVRVEIQSDRLRITIVPPQFSDGFEPN
jgi:hypothetical protein